MRVERIGLVGDDLAVPCVDGMERRYLDLDAAASTSALPVVAERVAGFLPWYSSVHRGAGCKSQLATAAYEDARAAILRLRRRAPDDDDVAIICRNTTEAINHLAYRLAARARTTSSSRRSSSITPTCCRGRAWRRRRFVECDADGTFDVDAVARRSTPNRAPRLLAITGASNVTGWVPPIEPIIADRPRARRARRSSTPRSSRRTGRLPVEADFLAWSGHKMYAPFGAGVLIGPRAAFAARRPVPRRRRRGRPRRPRRGRLDRSARPRGGRLAERARRGRARRRRR